MVSAQTWHWRFHDAVKRGGRTLSLTTSIGGVLTVQGGDVIIIGNLLQARRGREQHH